MQLISQTSGAEGRGHDSPWPEANRWSVSRVSGWSKVGRVQATAKTCLRTTIMGVRVGMGDLH